MTGVCKRRGTEKRLPREDKLMILELHCHKPRNAWGYRKLNEARKCLWRMVSEWTSSFQTCEKIVFCSFKLCSLQYFAMAALRN